MNTKKIVVNGLEIKMDVTAFVKWENRAKAEGIEVSELLSRKLAVD